MFKNSLIGYNKNKTYSMISYVYLKFMVFKAKQ